MSADACPDAGAFDAGTVEVIEVLGYAAVAEHDSGLGLAWAWALTSEWAMDIGQARAGKLGLQPLLRAIPAGFVGTSITGWPVVVESDGGVVWIPGTRPRPELAGLAHLPGVNDFMLGFSPSGKLHMFKPDRTLSQCGLVYRSMASPSTYTSDIAAISAGVELCKSCFPRADEVRAVLAQRKAA